MIILWLNNNTLLTEKVSLIVIIPVMRNTSKDKLNVNFELFFLKTPRTSKNIIESEINISGNIKFKFSIYLLAIFVACMLIKSVTETSIVFIKGSG